MWAFVVLLTTINIIPAWAQTAMDYEPHATYNHERNPDLDPEREASRATAQLQQSASTQHRPSDGLGEYAQMLSCLQRKQMKLHKSPERGTAVGHAGFKAQRNDWIQDLKSIEAELERTRCRPREVCLQVSAEHPTSTSTFYAPKCVSVHRCGGCCSGEGSQCIDTSQAFISKTLIEITVPPSREPRPVFLLFVNHTGCGCARPLTPLRSIIRRASADAHPTKADTIRPQNLDPARCNKIHVSCTSGLSWDPLLCRCAEDKKVQDSRGLAEGTGVCGAQRVFSEDSCSCVCKNGLDQTTCGNHRILNKDSCSCVCKNGLNSLSCGPHGLFSEDSCSCACKNGLNSSSCGPHRVFNKDSCSCVCKNGLNSSSCGPHRVFNKDSCSCVCKNGLNSLSCGPHGLFSEDSCSCACKNGLNSSSCGPHRVFNEDSCSCVCKNSLNSSSCGLHKVFNEDVCSCACKNGLDSLSCGPLRFLEDSTCACVCPVHAQRDSCKPDWGWDEQKCHCVCQKSCPKNKPLNMATCQCECQEQGISCLRRGMKFDPLSCSCHRLPCPRRRPRCPSNHYYSVSVCHCLPNHLRAFEHH